MVDEADAYVKNNLTSTIHAVRYCLPGRPPTWQLRMTRSLSSFMDKAADHVTIGEDQPGSK